MPTAVITGVTGQDGSYLAELLHERGYQVIGVTRSATASRAYDLFGDMELIRANLPDEAFFRRLIERYRPREIYNLGARASSSQFFDDPVQTGDANGLSVARILEAIRVTDSTIRFCQASSSEMFGNADRCPQNECTAFHPRNPYGAAKLFGHAMTGIYRERFGMFACSSILFNHESPRRSEQFVTRKISMGVARIKAGLADELQLGSLAAARDWGYAPDYVRAMWLMLQAGEPADYVVATGESHSVRELCEIAFARVGLDYRRYLRSDPRVERPPESVPLVGDTTRARTLLNWRPTVSFHTLVHLMVDADVNRLAATGSPG